MLQRSVRTEEGLHRLFVDQHAYQKKGITDEQVFAVNTLVQESQQALRSIRQL